MFQADSLRFGEERKLTQAGFLMKTSAEFTQVNYKKEEHPNMSDTVPRWAQRVAQGREVLPSVLRSPD